MGDLLTTILLVDIVDLRNSFFVAFLGDVGRDKGVNDLFDLVERILACSKGEHIRTVVLA